MIKDQLVLDKVKAILAANGIDSKSVVISDSFLKVLQPVTNAKSKYKFDLKQTSQDAGAGSAAIEMKLDRNDAFIASSIGFGILPVVSGNFGKAKLQTYPNQTSLPPVTTVGSEFTTDDLNVFWNSILALKVGNVVHIPNLDTTHFYFAPETQKSAATNYDQYDGKQHGFKDLTPQIMLKGDDNIDLTIEAPYFNAIKVANTNANTVNYLVMWLRGFLIKEITR